MPAANGVNNRHEQATCAINLAESLRFLNQQSNLALSYKKLSASYYNNYLILHLTTR